jgi:tRNA dimethylallyltransferase
VFRLTGQPLSSFHASQNGNDRHGWSSTPLLSLEPAERGWLHERIAERFEAMLAAGFLEEVRALRSRGDLSPTLPSMRCVGYRQAWTLLDAHEAQHPAGPFPIAQLRDQGIFATRQLAKRQLTWLRGMPQRRVITCDARNALAEVLEQARAVS